MNNILDLSKELNRTIRESSLYQEYQLAKKKLKERPDLIGGLNEFRRKNIEIQNNEGIDNPYDEVNNLFMEYDELLHDTIVNDYLRAERKLCRIMRNVYEEIANELELDINA